MALFFAQTVIAGASLVFEVAVALRMLHLGQSGVGYLGAVTGSAASSVGSPRSCCRCGKRIAFDFGVGVLLWVGAARVRGGIADPRSCNAAMALIGVGNSLVDVNAFTILQRIVPDEVMGRVFGAVESLLVAGMALGALLMPLLINTVGLRWGLAIIGAVGRRALVIAGVNGLNRIDTTTARAGAPPAHRGPTRSSPRSPRTCRSGCARARRVQGARRRGGVSRR